MIGKPKKVGKERQTKKFEIIFSRKQTAEELTRRKTDGRTTAEDKNNKLMKNVSDRKFPPIRERSKQ